MKIETDKKELLNWIKNLNDPAILNTLQSVRKKTIKNDFWNDLTAKTQKKINKGKTQLDEGKGIPDDQVRKEIWQKFFK